MTENHKTCLTQSHIKIINPSTAINLLAYINNGCCVSAVWFVNNVNAFMGKQRGSKIMCGGGFSRVSSC